MTFSRQRSVLACLVALCLATLGVALLSAPRAEAAPRSLDTGISYVYGNEPEEFAHVAATGAEFVLTAVNWAKVAPAQEPASWNPADPADSHYDWEFLDGWVKNAIAAGLTPVLQVRGAPAWAQNCGPTYYDSPCEPDPAKLAQFARAAASRYSGRFGGLPRVRYWQGLNEPNYDFYFKPQFRNSRPVSPRLYRQLINSFYAAVKSVDPANVVLMAGLGPIGVPGHTIAPLRFARELLCMTGGPQHPRKGRGSCEGGVHFDVFDVHPYTSGGPTHEGGGDFVELGDIPRLQRLLRAADRAGRIKSNLHKRTPLWIVEMSWDTKPPDPNGISFKLASQWIAEALYRTWKQGVDHFFWFTIVDFDRQGRPPNESFESGFYFWNPDVAAQRAKPTIKAFRFPFVALRRDKGLMVWGRTPTSSGGMVRIEAVRNGAWKTLRTLRAAGNGMFTTVLGSSYGKGGKGAVRATYLGESSVPFPMNPVGDHRVNPFG
ncbi:MAG: hypothetical protein AB7V58_18300 [Solirubrobacterales bacterium]